MEEQRDTNYEIIDIKNWVTKSNNLIEATYKLSLQEQRILLVLASKVQPSDEFMKQYHFRAKDFIEIIGNKKGTGFYTYLKEVVDGLQSKTLSVIIDGKLRNYNWVITSIYDSDNSYITLELHPKLKDFFLKLKEKFTSYQLENVVKLNSVYAIRIYELLKQYEKLKKRELSLQDLRNLLAIKPDTYKQYGHFKNKVLLVAQKEINQKTDIEFEFEEVKTKRKVTGIAFIINSKHRILNIEEATVIEEDSEERLLMKELLSLKVSKAKIDWVLNEFPIEQIQRNISYVKSRNEVSTIKHLGSYTIKSIQNDFAQTSKRENRTGKAKSIRVEKVPSFIEENQKVEEIKEAGSLEERKALYFKQRGTQEEFESLLLEIKNLKKELNEQNPDAEEVAKEAVRERIIQDVKQRQEIGLKPQPISEYKNSEIQEIYQNLILEHLSL